MSGCKSKEFWDGHVAAAEHSGKPLSQYAAEHGLNREVLYAARNRRVRANSGAGGKTVSAFVPVKVAAVRATQIARGAALIARLPNGVVIECEVNRFTDTQARALVAALASV